MKTIAAALLLTVATVTTPANAYADCGDPSQDPL